MRAALIALTLLGIPAAAAAAPPTDVPRRVLILTGADVMLPASLVEDSMVRRTLANIDERSIEFFSEGLDAYRFRSEEYESELVAFFLRKYRGRTPDVIVAVSELAQGFLMRHRGVLWPESPVLFSSVAKDFFSGGPPPSWATGFLENTDVEGTLRLAAALQPDLDRIVVVTSASDDGSSDTARRVSAFRPDVPVVLKAGIPVSRFPREFGALPERTIILYTAMFRDVEGRVTIPREVLRSLVAASPVPVYGLYSTYLGSGIVGGSLHDYELEGRAVAALARRVLLGERPSAIPVQAPSLYLLAVDARQLKRFGIPERRVPVNAALRFRTPTFWELYRWRIVAMAAALALETALIIALLVERRRRKRAEKESRQRRRELVHASRLTTVGELTASISHEINQPLGAILANAEVAEVLLESNPGNVEEVRQILADIRRDDLRASEVVRRVRKLAGNRDVEMKSIAINEIVDAAVRTLRHEAQRRGVAVETDLASGLPRSRGDEISIQQVVLNLALNGMEAMTGAPAGRRRLSVRTSAEDGRVAVRVSDAGRGIRDAEWERLFRPFFTTKEQGMGLGLSICRSIVEAHGGSIVARNNPEGGATFEFLLPAGERAAGAGRSAPGGERTS